MADPEHIAKIKEGFEAWNAWRKANPWTIPDLSSANLSYAHLIKTNLRGANLREANLRGAHLGDANLSLAYVLVADMIITFPADLSGADLFGADLRGADLSDADLSGTDLSGTDLFRANLSHSKLSDAIISNAVVANTIFGNIALSQVKGLETVKHTGPSTIGIDTIIKSQGKIPEKFLRGAGVPDNLINYFPSLVGSIEAIQFYSCFISYSQKDEEFARRLHSRMQQEHLRVWYAPEKIKGGEKLFDQIDHAIRVYDKLLLVLSDESMQSQWVQTEIYSARQREIKEDKRILFPIRLVGFEKIREWKCFDADTGKDLGREIREYFIPDFTEWKDHDKFEEAFKKLIDDLKKEVKPQE